jgi:WD40 repeat protein
MTELEERLRNAFQAKADDISPELPRLYLQPVRRPGSVTRRGGRRAWPRASRRWLAPVAAAAAVLAVVAAALAAAGALPGIVTPAVAPTQVNVPPYYVALTSAAPSASVQTPAVKVATVRLTSTGAVIARIRPPRPYTGFLAVSGAADDRTFVLLAQGQPDLHRRFGYLPQAFFILHIDPAATSPASRAQLTAMPATDTPSSRPVQTMALSPDGQSLAALLGTGNGYFLYIYNLATGQTHIWVSKRCSSCQPGVLGDMYSSTSTANAITLSWTRDGRRLAFVAGEGSQVRLLDLTAPGDNVQPDSKPFAIHGMPVAYWSVVYMTPDGKTLFIGYPTGRGRSNWVGLMRFSVATGKLTSINNLTVVNEGTITGYIPHADAILWSNYNGSKIVVMGARPGQTAGVYSGSSYTPIPWPAYVVDAAW